MNMRDKIAAVVRDYEHHAGHEQFVDAVTDAIIAALDVDALIRAALERAEQAARGFYRERPGLGEKRTPDRSDMGRGVQRGKEQAADAIIALAADDEAMAAIKAKAGWVI